jgi:cation:H+ antiporter
LSALLFFAAGLAVAAIGGELFVRGLLAAARRFHLPAAFVGATIAAFATSGPELGVSVLAALDGTPQIGLGDALGSNVVNLGLVLGSSIVLAGLRPAPAGDRRTLGFLLAAPLLAAALLLDGLLSRADAALLIAVFLSWLALELRSIERAPPPLAPVAGAAVPLVLGTGGLVLLFVAGELIVTAARAMADLWQTGSYFVGATLVALGTSVPELATAVAARARGHHELGLSTLIGSNLFNGLFIVGTAGLIQPIRIDPPQALVALAAALLLSLVLLPRRGAALGRGRGALLLAGYACYVLALLRASV